MSQAVATQAAATQAGVCGEIYRAPLRGFGDWPIHRVSFTQGAAEALVLGVPIPGVDVHPWVVIRLRELLDRHRPAAGRPHGGATTAEVRALETAAIFELLAERGVAIDAMAFVGAAADHHSAWDLSETWDIHPGDGELAGFASCELWRRLCSERPSLEMLDEQMQAGFDALDAGEPTRACEVWLDYTDALFARLPSSVSTIADADASLPGLCSIGNWIGDAEVTLFNASLRSSALRARAIGWYSKVASRFRADPACRGLRGMEAELHLRGGDHSEGVAMLNALVDEDPDDSMPHALLADWYDGAMGNPSPDPRRAIEVLERALARPVRNPDAYDLRERLADLRKRREKR